MKKIIRTVVIASLAVAAFSCDKKYEDGPAVSVMSRKERVANYWKIQKAIENGEDISEDYDQYDLYLTKNGDATLTANYSYGTFTFSSTTNGSWTLQNDDTELEVDFENNDADETYQILKLEEKELWLRAKGKELELHLVPQ